MLVTVIVACEIGFWVVLAAGLISRYLAGRPRLGAALLLCVPIVDLVLLIATVVDLRSGATANFTHGLAAAYLGFSVAFGHSTVRWADSRFAHRFAGGPSPLRPPKYGRERVRYEWREFAKACVAWAVSCALLLAGIVLVGDAARTAALSAWLGRLTVVLLIWFVGWPLWVTLRPPQAAEDRVGQHIGRR